MDDEKHKVAKASNGTGWDLELKSPDGDRKFVRIKVLRVKDLRKILEIEKAGEMDSLAETMWMVGEFTDIPADETDSLALDDLHGIQEVILGQVKKLAPG